MIYLDLVCYKNADVIEGLAGHFRAKAFQNCVDENHYPTRLERFHLSLESMQIDSEVLTEQFVEFPRINEKFDGKVYRYAYLVDPRQESSKQDIRPIYKIDMQTKKTWQWDEEGCYPGEPVFVATPKAHSEDEGVILSVVLDQNKGNSFLLVLDAQTMQEIARSRTPHKISVGLHGQYFNA